MDLCFITALWCGPHPLDFSSETTGTNASCICTCLSCLLSPVCALKKRKHTYNLSHIHTGWGVFTAPTVCPWSNCRQPTLPPLLWHFLNVFGKAKKNLSATHLQQLELPRWWRNIAACPRQPKGSGSTTGVGKERGSQLHSLLSGQDEDEKSALVISPRRSATSMLNLPCPGLMFQWRYTMAMHFWTGWWLLYHNAGLLGAISCFRPLISKVKTAYLQFPILCDSMCNVV